MNLANFNKHRNKDYFYGFSQKRKYFSILQGQLSKKFIISIVWLRRVGKTTLILQLIDGLIQTGKNRFNILYYTFDNWWDIEDVISNYQKISNRDINKDQIYIFLDEIQKAADWQNKIKIYYDLYPNIKFIISWSASLFLNHTESLAGRITTNTIKPLFFDEFLEFKKLSYLLDNAEAFEDKIILEFEKYLYRQFRDIIDSDLIEAQSYIKKLKDKIIKEDLVNYFDIKHPDLLSKIFDILCKNPGMLIDYKNIANDLNFDWRTIQTYTHYLEEAFLIKKIYNYSPNLLTSEKKLKKIYLNSTSFFTWDGNVPWELFENYIIDIYDAKYFWRLNKKEVDIILIKDKKIIPIEVKYKSQLKKNDFDGLNFFIKKNKLSSWYIITKGLTQKYDNIKAQSFLSKFNLDVFNLV